jgi:hypothetical protein
MKTTLQLAFLVMLISCTNKQHKGKEDIDNSEKTESEITIADPIRTIDRIFFTYVEHSESTDSRSNLDSLTVAFRQLEKNIDEKDLELIINFWMYYSVTDFPTRELTEKILLAQGPGGITAVEQRISNKKEWEQKDEAPYSELEYLLSKLKNE